MKSLDLNMVISDFETMLRRLIGENIEVKTFLKPSLGTVEADPGQIDQILMNLAVNARDAMPEGGALTIETDDIYLDGDYCRSHPEVTPGNYLLFAVTDTGRGMDTETLGRIFDPFFTTKEKGVGTGLGLATVYGIVKQHRGHVSVYSEVGRGTTFKVYLPRIEGALEPFTAAQAFTPDRGTETVLVVEDEEAVRDISCEALAMLGYLPLAAADSDEAIAISEAHSGRIHLLLTDVVLPKKDGRSLYELLAKTRPDMKALFMSRYTENFVVHHGVLDKEVHFIQKPFTVDHLARKIREVLDSA
jgi:CheY-like chemotaxis protein